MKWFCILFNVCMPVMCVAQKQVIFAGNIHLRDGIKREWSSFPVHAKDSQLVIHFKASYISHPATLAIIQADVNHTWNVILNGNVIGNLVPDENKMVSYFPVSRTALNENDNTLIIRSELGNVVQADDIVVGNVSLYKKAIESLLQETSLNIHSGIPSRLTILNDSNALQPVYAQPGDTLAIRNGVIYSGTGNFKFTLPAGKYRLYGSRGFEYGVDSAVVVLAAAQKLSRRFTLKHEVNLKNWASVDTHVHTLEYSGHGDASMKERILTIAGEGLDYAVITEHNKVVNISDSVKKMKLNKWFTPIRGDELTTSVGHFNLFPASSPPSPKMENWQQVRQNITRHPEVKVVILNHARDEHNGFRPTDTMQLLSAAEFPANAMEVMNSGSQQTDPRQLYLDWLGLIGRGIVLTPVGSSDSHDVSRFIVGQSRTYVQKGDIIQHFVERKVGVSFGLFTELAIDPKTKKSVSIMVHCPSWITPNRVRLFANGKEIYSSAISNLDKKDRNVYARKIDIPAFSNETILVAVAEGDNPNVPWWPVAKPYQHTSPDVNPIVLGLTGPIKVLP